MQKTPTKKNNFTRRSSQYIIILGIIICLAVMAMVMMVHRSIVSRPSKPIPVSFSGEYSQNGGEWQILNEDTRINALNGDLVLRGNFNFEKDEVPFNVYLDNISMTIFVDGNEEYTVLNPDPDCKDFAGNNWINWTSKAFTTNSTVEIHISNALAVGNPNAYNDFLDNMYVGTKSTLTKYILSPSNYFSQSKEFQDFEGVSIWAYFLQSGQLWRGIGFGVFVISFLMFGVAMADSLQSKLFGRKLWLLGALSLFSAGIMVLDTPDVNLWHTNIVFNTYGAQLCRMLWLLTLSLFATELLSGRRQLAAFITVLLGGIFDTVTFLLFIFGNTYVADVLMPWFVVQVIIVIILIIAGILELKNRVSRKQKWELIALIVILCSVAAELGNARFGFWQRGIFTNSVFVLILLIFGIFAANKVPETYRKAEQATALETELVQNRISIMLSQIQPHFLYNSLNSIRQLCKSDPAEAQIAIENFAKYLRNNLDSIKRNTLVPFTKEMEHIRIYLALEKMRFEDELQIVWKVEADGFMLPSLTIQPLVENAVKYGVGKKPGGGTVTISTTETAKDYVITVHDDGVGYDPTETQDDGRTHIGIDNVRSRLGSMCQGTLNIETTPGIGTTATVRIPKEGQR